MKFDRYGLTKDGEAISVDAYCLSISKIPSTYVTLLQDRDDFGTVTDQNIDWSSPFNELTYGSDPVNTQEFCDAIERFCCYHYDKVSEFHINLKERGVWEDQVHIVPQMYEEID